VNDVQALNVGKITKLFYDQITLITISIDKRTRRKTQTIKMIIILTTPHAIMSTQYDKQVFLYFENIDKNNCRFEPPKDE